ncbi:RCC1 domain-containing protein 1-like [Osmerus mordax]|uniref:RCC1 domain-containing protein 1-like n=1 Tax=Osmerus mordax TaxID=8014 RepID=UPI00351078A6
MWYAFGFNGFNQIMSKEECAGESSDIVKVTVPTKIQCCKFQGKPVTNNEQSYVGTNTRRIRASWSRRATLHDAEGEDGRVCLSGFGEGPLHQACCGSCLQDSRGCRDADISEGFLTLAFSDRVKCWDLNRNDTKPVWSMEIKTSDEAGQQLAFPLVPGGYISSKPPFYHSLSPQLRARSLVVGTEHVILLTASGAVYTWGYGSHGQLGHGELSAEEEPRAVEALWGLPMSSVAAGGWHSAGISVGGDLYVWGWNESGQLGLPAQALRGKKQRTRQHTGASTSTCVETEEGEKSVEVFISIQAFPGLLDITESCDISMVSCGSRHTAAVTSTGDLYTWGWGEYGQLGDGTLRSSDEPGRLDFFKDKGLHVVDIVCGPWNTFVGVKEERTPPFKSI